MKGKRTYYFCVAAIVCIMACKRPYEPELKNIKTNFLIVGGSVNTAANGISTIYLSRTKPVNDTTPNLPERSARVSIEGKSGASYFLSEELPGVYKSQPVTLSAAQEYRVRIITSDGQEYASSYLKSKNTPAIDSVNWEQENDLKIYVNTSDPSNSTRYYQWQYEETFEYLSLRFTPWGLNGNAVFVKSPAQQTDTCWKSSVSTDILIGNSSGLINDVIQKQPVVTIPLNDNRLVIRYSILVKQYAIDEEAYKYWDVIRKNSKNLGTLFDIQPSRFTNNNIRSLSKPDEPVIGYMIMAQEQQKRIFIKNDQLQNWSRVLDIPVACAELFLFQTLFPVFNYPDETYAPWYYTSGGGTYIAKKDCLDCSRLSIGGITKRPSFW